LGARAPLHKWLIPPVYGISPLNPLIYIWDEIWVLYGGFHKILGL